MKGAREEALGSPYPPKFRRSGCNEALPSLSSNTAKEQTPSPVSVFSTPCKAPSEKEVPPLSSENEKTRPQPAKKRKARKPSPDVVYRAPTAKELKAKAAAKSAAKSKAKANARSSGGGKPKPRDNAAASGSGKKKADTAPSGSGKKQKADAAASGSGKKKKADPPAAQGQAKKKASQKKKAEKPKEGLFRLLLYSLKGRFRVVQERALKTPTRHRVYSRVYRQVISECGCAARARDAARQECERLFAD